MKVLAIILASVLAVSAYDEEDYKKIFVRWKGKKRCWDAVKVKINNNWVRIPYATKCKYTDSQYWAYTEDGQIFNSKYQKCLTYDQDHNAGFIWNNNKTLPVYIFLDGCNEQSVEQRFLYVDKHWVSAYGDGTCIDLVSEHGDTGGFFDIQGCKKCYPDQEFTIEDDWFFEFDDSNCSA